MGLQAELRAAAVALFTDYAASVTGQRLQVYPGRPRSLKPPTAFVDRIRERITYDGLRQRTVYADCIVVHGLFDSAEAAAQKDAFADGFLDWACANPHEASANSLVAVTAFEDLPDWMPDWTPGGIGGDQQPHIYFATAVTLEAYGE